MYYLIQSIMPSCSCLNQQLESEIDSIIFVWSLIVEDLSFRVTQVIVMSRRAGTQISYNAPIGWWLDLCSIWKYHPHYTTVSQIFDFLRQLYKKGLDNSANGTTVPSVILKVLELTRIEKDLLLARPLKGFFNVKTPQVR